jgi:hypothetical protein
MYALIIYLLMALTAIRRKNQDRKHVDSKTDKDCKPFPVPLPVINVPVAPSDQERATQKKKNSREKWKFRGEVAGLVILTVYAGFTIAIWCANKKAADAAKEAADTARNTLITSQRPWVHPPAPIRITKPIILERDKIVVFGEMLLKNYGPSPALSVVSSVDIVTDIKTYQQRADSGCNLIERISRENEFAKDKFGPPLFPQETMGQPFANSDDTPHPNLTVLYFAGCIIYRDQFGATLHHTRFCFETPKLAKDFTTTDTLVNCNIGQEAD